MSYVTEYEALEDPTTAPEALEGKPKAHARIMADRVWLVLARRGYEEPLRQVGTVEADDAELACVYARSIYDEFAWVEMAIVPRDDLITVIES
jgi:1,2-phenylacetyl-CoA epoxidase PaaB subunit